VEVVVGEGFGGEFDVVVVVVEVFEVVGEEDEEDEAEEVGEVGEEVRDEREVVILLLSAKFEVIKLVPKPVLGSKSPFPLLVSSPPNCGLVSSSSLFQLLLRHLHLLSHLLFLLFLLLFSLLFLLSLPLNRLLVSIRPLLHLLV